MRENKSNKVERDTWSEMLRILDAKNWIVEDKVLIWRALKTLTKGESRKIVETVPDEDGSECCANLATLVVPVLAMR